MVAFLTLHRLGFKISLQEFFTAFKTFQAANGINSYSWRGFSFLSGKRKGDSDPSVTLLALLGFSTLVGGRPGIQK